MQRVTVLREQAALMRRLAESFDGEQIRQDLLNLAEKCEALAASVARKLDEKHKSPDGE
jgi:hypothetical protein